MDYTELPDFDDCRVCKGTGVYHDGDPCPDCDNGTCECGACAEKNFEDVVAEVLRLREENAKLTALLDKIMATMSGMRSVTNLCPPRDYEGIPLAISDLRACYTDAARARNGMYTKLQAENEKLRAECRKEPPCQS